MSARGCSPVGLSPFDPTAAREQSPRFDRHVRAHAEMPYSGAEARDQSSDIRDARADARDRGAPARQPREDHAVPEA